MAREFDRRSLLAGGAAAAAGAAGLTAADSLFDVVAAGAEYTNGRGRNGLSSAKPKRGGHLNVGVASEQQGFSPAAGRLDGSGFVLARTVYDPLMAVTATGRCVPYLAESLTSNKDSTKWTITVRPGIKFHDGTPLDGEALYVNMDKEYKSPLTGVAIQPNVAAYEVSGPRSLTITMKRPWTEFAYTLAAQQICFTAAPSMLNSPDGGTTHPVGTGPFVFDEWIPNDHFSVRANKAYWRKGLPYLDSITFKPIPDEQARAQALRAGTIDMMAAFSADTMLEFRGNKQWSYADDTGKMVGSPNVSCVMLNTAKAPFDDIEARRIVATGTSSAAFSKTMDRGLGGAVNGIYQPGSPYYSKHNPYPAFNQAKAAQLARAYRAKHGHALAFTLNTVASPGTLRAAQLIQQMMKNIGVTVTIETMQQNQLINDALSGSFQGTQWNQFGAVSPDLNYIWFSTTTVNDSGISINMARNSDPKLQAAMLAGMASPKASVRTASWRRVNELLGQDIPYVWTGRYIAAIVSRPNVQNWAGPKAPNGTALLGNNQGVFWSTQIWKS